MPKNGTLVRQALQSQEARDACVVLAYVHEAMMVLDEMSPPALEALRDEFDSEAKQRSGPRGELKRAWAAYVQQLADDARTKEEPLRMYEKVR
ncbi:MAG: hypothetical protein J2P54_15595 [Bradyrhizobiaceae bacterium]|nr:hypothetical protein [Bradyrhizobiaceae bacterium]